MNDGSITFSTELDNKKLEKDLAGLKKEIESLQAKITKNEDARSPLIAQAELIQSNMAAAKAEVEKYKQAWMSGAQGADRYEMDAAEKVSQLKSEYNQVLEKIEKYDTVIEKSNIQLNAAKDKAGGLHKQIAKASSGIASMAPAVNRAQKGMQKFALRMKEVVRSALIFTVISRSVSAMRDWFGKVVKTNADATAAIARLKGSLLTLAQPLVEIVIPAFMMFVNILSNVLTATAKGLSAIFGTTINKSQQAAKSLYKQTNAIKSTGNAAQKAGKQIAGFDEINTLASNNMTGSGASDTGAIEPDFSGIKDAVLKEKIDKITTYVSGALLALGAILAFSGFNIPLGIALMAAGAIGLASVISENWNAMDGEVGKAIDATLLVIAGAGLVIGAILAFSGANIPIGIGLLAIGAAALATEVALNWSSIKQELQGSIGKVTAIVSAALLVLGAILAFSGTAIPLGIALMAAGASGLATVTAVNWDTIKQALQGPIGKITAIVSTALLVLGAILAFSGVAIPLGIGLMLAGAAGLAAVTVVNWETVKNKIKTVLASALAIVSGALIVIGVLMCLSGAGIGLGLALIAAGIAGSVVAWRMDDNPVTRFVKNIANGVLSVVNMIINAINDLFHIRVPELSIAGHVIIPKIDTRLIHIPNIPYLAQGAVIPPNREFMAVLGDQNRGRNLEAPENLLRQIYSEETAKSNAQTANLLEQIVLLLQQGKDIHLTVPVDGRPIVDMVIKENDIRNRRFVTAGGY